MKYAVIVLFGIMLLLPVASVATTTISGRTLYGDNSWDSSMNPIIVTGDITIALGATLNIGEGCEVRFQENSDDTHWGWDLLRSEIIVYGTLNVNGTPSNLVTLTSTGTAVNGWFGIVFSDDSSSGTLSYCNIDHSVYGIEFKAFDATPPNPTVNYCFINDVTSGIRFDGTSSPFINNTTVINAVVAFDCWGVSAPRLTNCNTSGLTGSAKALYVTEYSTPIIVGCSFSSAGIDLDMHAGASMMDSTVSDAVAGIVGEEFKLVGLAKIPSACSMRVNNCNIIGRGGEGRGIEWDDNLKPITVEYSRLGGFTRLIWARWGTIDPAVNILHMVGPRQATSYTSTCTGGDHYYLVDSSANFLNLGAVVGMTVTNIADSSTGIVVEITSVPSFPVTYNALRTSGMSGGAINDFGEIYSFPMSPDYNNIDLGDLGTPDPYRNWPPGHLASAGQNEFYGVQDPSCLLNVDLEQGASEPPSLYQLEVWAQGNWWISTNDIVISRYIWDWNDSGYLGAVHYLPHRTPDLKRTYSVSGRIMDTVGSPLEGVRVYTDISAQFPGHTVLADITDSDGYYTIYGLLPSGTSYGIIPEKLRYTFSPSARSVTISTSTPVDVTGQDFTVFLPAPRIINVGRADNQDGALHGLPGRTNWALIGESVAVVVSGTDFRDTPALFMRGPIPVIEDTKLSDILWVTSTKLTVTTPASLAAGDYSVRLVNPDGQESFFGDTANPGFTIVNPPSTPTPVPTPPIKYPRIKVSTDALKYKKGNSLVLSAEIWPDTSNVMRNLIDPYIAGLTPNGRLLFLSKGQWRSSATPVLRKIMIGGNLTFIMGNFELGQNLPSGTYTIFGVLTAPGTSVFNTKNWRSSLASTTFVVE
ncbi:MAG: carboxypeptidase-like regulatory domain-containing protein [Candidatus Aureabacteria bacterium]|nr:carboxypeptidase-like regulatory domain-containing protein [Candidatus Auribacterota bacterium]